MKFYSLSLLAALMLTISCVKKPDHSKVDYGDEVSEQNVSDALNALNFGDPYSPQKGEFWKVYQSYYVNRVNPVILGEMAYKVIDRTSSPAEVRLAIRREEGLYENGKPVGVGEPNEETLVLERQTNNSLQPATLKTSFDQKKKSHLGIQLADLKFNQKNKISLMNNLKPSQVKLMEEKQPVRVSYHRLNVKNIEMPPPADVKKAANCGGLANCESMNVVQIMFDVVSWYADETSDVTRWYFTASPDMPFLHRIKESFHFPSQLSYCYEVYMETYVPVLFCEETTNFAFGTN